MSDLAVLMVEDEDGACLFLKQLLESTFGARVDVAVGCAGARASLESVAYDVVTLDLQLPDGSGLELLKEITTLNHPPRVLVLTGRGSEQAAADCMRYGASGYIVEDDRLSANLVEVMEKTLSAIRAEREAKALLEEKQFIDNVMNTMNDFLFVVDKQGKAIAWNRAVNDVTGYTDHEIRRMDITDWYRPEDSQTVLNAIDELVLQRPEGAVTTQATVVTKDGTHLVYEGTARALKDDKGTVIGLCGIGRDVTERTRFEEEIRQSEERFRVLVENSEDVFVLLDATGTITYISPSVKRLYGYDPAELVGESGFKHVAPDDVESLVQILADKIGEPDATVCVEYRYQHKDGSWHTHEAICQNHTDDPALDAIVLCSRDITERRGINEELRAVKERLQHLLSVAPAVVYSFSVIGNDIRINFVSDTISELLGYEPDEFTGSFDFWLSCVHPEDLPPLMSALPSLHEKGYNVHVYRFKNKDGAYRWLYDAQRAVPDSEEGTLEVIGAWVDITERKQLEDELGMKNTELEGFAHTVSHDLKGPVAAIGFAAQTLEVLLARPVEERSSLDLEEIAKIIDVNVARTSELIDDILALAEAGQVPPEVTDVDVREVVDGVVEEHGWVIERNRIAFRIDDRLGTVRAARTHIYQVFSNLVDNAIRYNDNPEPAVDIAYLGDEDGGGHRYRVRDNGSGIPAEELDSLFIPFFKGRKGGTGIGLATVAKIVDVYGVEIRAYTDNGACFEFVLRDFESEA
ncbi:MAG: PAS domain S-box protein [Acidobacteria bacterium]|nr:PAS domain S-box protein [Acidobacteriota bacterium]